MRPPRPPDTARSLTREVLRGRSLARRFIDFELPWAMANQIGGPHDLTITAGDSTLMTYLSFFHTNADFFTFDGSGTITCSKPGLYVAMVDTTSSGTAATHELFFPTIAPSRLDSGFSGSRPGIALLDGFEAGGSPQKIYAASSLTWFLRSSTTPFDFKTYANLDVTAASDLTLQDRNFLIVRVAGTDTML